MTGKNFAIIADAFGVWFFGAGLIALVLATISAILTSDVPTASRVFSLGLLISGSSVICGWLLGLLFGIPRTLARPQPAPANENSQAASVDSNKPTSRVNTNLEDVSDWLTKTLIGVGLTQLYILPDKLWSIAKGMNTFGFGWAPHGQLLGLGLMLYFAPGGFWLGYVATRTILTKLFDSVEATDEEAEIVLAKDQFQLGVEGRQIAPATDPEVIQADRALLRRPLHAMGTSKQLAAWGVAKARAGELETGVVALEQARDADPGDQTIRDVLLKLYTAQDRKPEAEGMLRNAPLSDIAVLWALHEDKPDGFRRAINLGEDLLKQSGQKTNANLRVWLACAYGQQHGQALKDGEGATAESALSKVIENIEAAIKADPRVRPLLNSLWKPKDGSTEDDLSSIAGDDPDLTRLLAE